MLTSKIGKTIVNCFDKKYDRYTFKQWSDKNILKCPVCDGIYEYCHGEIVSPYFRHKDKECEGYYSEPETDEHKKGKIILYNWIKSQPKIENCKLEAWIPETKQRPDIYFEYDGEKFVIEFQCSPIASEYIKRRELYKLNNIKDIWILGTKKYKITIDKDGNINHDDKFKSIEKAHKDNGLMYLDVKNEILYFDLDFLQKNGLLKNINDHWRKKFFFRDNCLMLKGLIGNGYFDLDKLENFRFDKRIRLNKSIIELFNEVEINLNNLFKIELEEELLLNNLVKKAKSESSFVGSIGDDIEINGILVKNHPFKSKFFGESWIVEIVDTNNNLFTWFTYKDIGYKIGDKFLIKGIIKDHSIYLGVNQNILEGVNLQIIQ